MPTRPIPNLSLLIAIYLALLAGCTGSPSQTPQGNTTAVEIPYQSQDYCTLVSSDTLTPDPTEAALKALVPEPGPMEWMIGPESAEVTIIEYADFQCPGCAAMAPILDQLRQDYPNTLRLIYRDFPNPIHDKALMATQAAEAAGLQGKFWLMHDELFSRQSEWSLLSADDFAVWLERIANTIGLDVPEFKNDFTSQAIIEKAEKKRDEAIQLGIPYTPFLIINGTMWQGPREYQSLRDVIALLLLENRQVTGCPPYTIDRSKQYLATITTDKGTIIIQLFADKAPLAVNSFIFLAKRGYYDGNSFHRVVDGYLAQTGDPSGTGYGGPGYSFPLEIDPGLSFNQPGMVGLANAGPDTNGSQFFITLRALLDLDGKYTIFGQVIQGLDVVQNLTARDTSNTSSISSGDQILQVTIAER